MTRRRDIEWKHCFLLSRFGPHSREAAEAEVALHSGLPDDAVLRELDLIYVNGMAGGDALRAPSAAGFAVRSRADYSLPLI